MLLRVLAKTFRTPATSRISLGLGFGLGTALAYDMFFESNGRCGCRDGADYVSFVILLLIMLMRESWVYGHWMRSCTWVESMGSVVLGLDW